MSQIAREGLAVTLAGVGAGSCLALGSARLLQHLLHGAAASDVVTHGAAGILVTCIILFACWGAGTTRGAHPANRGLAARVVPRTNDPRSSVPEVGKDRIPRLGRDDRPAFAVRAHSQTHVAGLEPGQLVQHDRFEKRRLGIG